VSSVSPHPPSNATIVKPTHSFAATEYGR
jgi:hypothetical protein